ncbi:hypothetical protein JKP88DRAFT_245774 [Tribonema minus]|uniref:Uncharacterized protein n=1 Tax=Tribonema minus TaxID=303371 RepID=A0A835Z2X2_9STRA|nr:hypothetical protein JKP88DRAFT_245774 [Tribonema minus]
MPSSVKAHMAANMRKMLGKTGLCNRYNTVITVNGIRVTSFSVVSNLYAEHTTPDHVAKRSQLLVHLEDETAPPKHQGGHRRELSRHSKRIGQALLFDLSDPAIGEWTLEPDGKSAVWRPRDERSPLKLCLPPRCGDESKRWASLHFQVMHTRLQQPEARTCTACPLPTGAGEEVEREDDITGDDIRYMTEGGWQLDRASTDLQN